MITTIISFLFIAPTDSHPPGYFAGAVIAFLILIYLIYSLIRPEKF